MIIVTRISFIFLLLATCCVKDRVNDKSSMELKSINSVKNQTDTITYQVLPEPPPIGVEVKTDSSVIRTNTYEDMNSVREFNELDSLDRTYYKEFYFNTHRLKEQGVFEDGYCVGVWRYYDNKGKLYKEIDFETGHKTLFGGRTEPFDDIFIEMKSKGDSTLRSFFGSGFFESHIQWDPNRSYYYSQNDSGNWFEIPSEKPERFLLRYFVKLDSKNKYSTIEFELNRKGRIISGEETLGLKQCNSGCKFSVDYSKAIEVAKQNGLKLGDKKHYVYLSWTKSMTSKTRSDFVGDYELVVADFINREKQGVNRIIDHFDAVVINPWTGHFLRRTKFENVGHVHEYSSSSSGLRESK